MECKSCFENKYFVQKIMQLKILKPKYRHVDFHDNFESNINKFMVLRKVIIKCKLILYIICNLNT